MIEQPIERAILRPWIVCEQGQRWLTGVRRFASQMMPAPLIASIVAADPTKPLAMLATQQQAIVLWAVQQNALIASCDRIAQVSIASPKVLQIVASAELSWQQRLVLSELRASVVIRHIEDLPKLAGLIQGYFASSHQHLD